MPRNSKLLLRGYPQKFSGIRRGTGHKMECTLKVRQREYPQWQKEEMDVGNTKGAPRRGLEFWRAAVARLQAGESAGAVAQELGVDVRGLNRWRQRLGMPEKDPQRQREAALVKEVERLNGALADKVLEVDFLQGALHKIEARRQKSGSTGAQASTTKSGK